ncbi:hypothetical protein GOBAR_DD16521 [Gossypium barbadense]|nr:hypothetical protein GOBAR_DD16521 [Gossypium barbadense]
MSSTEKEGLAVGAVATDQAITTNTNPLDTIIPLPGMDLTLSSGELKNLRSLDEAFDGNQLDPKAKPLIQRVPSILGRHEDFRKYFKPRVVSIGPLHHDDPTLHGSEKLKLKLAAHFVKNIGFNKETLYNNMKTEIGGLKKCYDPKELEKYSNDDQKLAWMFFVDGCAILQAVYMRYGQDYNPTRNELFIKNQLLTFVYSDLFLLENQLPFRVLELLTSSSKNGEKFMKAIKRFIDDTVITPADMKEPQSHQQDSINDFTVTSYMCFLDSLIDEAEDVKALRHASILYNELGSDEEVAKLFNKMNTDLVPSPTIYSYVEQQIHNHCKKMWINYAAQAYNTLFGSPSTCLAFVAAIAALYLCALQTYYTIHQSKISPAPHLLFKKKREQSRATPFLFNPPKTEI